jgi:hypothetical protein
MVEYLQELGIKTVLNFNRDFYADIKKKRIPEHDVLITNPPYSGEHKPKLLQYLSSNSSKPYALLLPVYTATKSYWKDFAELQTRSPQIAVPLYLLPPESYEYDHPDGTGKDIPPFFSAWFIGGYPSDQKELLRGHMEACRQSNVIDGGDKKRKLAECSNDAIGSKTLIGSLRCKVVDSIDKLISLGYVTEKRPNPKQRKKLKARIGSGSGSGAVLTDGSGAGKLQKYDAFNHVQKHAPSSKDIKNTNGDSGSRLAADSKMMKKNKKKNHRIGSNANQNVTDRLSLSNLSATQSLGPHKKKKKRRF